VAALSAYRLNSVSLKINAEENHREAQCPLCFSLRFSCRSSNWQLNPPFKCLTKNGQPRRQVTDSFHCVRTTNRNCVFIFALYILTLMI
jgi:hypothetical protein